MRSRLWVAVLALLAGCGDGVGVRTDSEPDPDLSFLRNGRTTRADLVARWGEPTRTSGDGSILGYRLSVDASGGVAAARPEPPAPLAHRFPRETREYSLVLLFEHDALVRHALHRVWP
jgi:hypothetical protein